MATRYSFRVLWSNEDVAFVATCPEFEGVSGFGETPEAALAEAQTSLDLAAKVAAEERWPLPQPLELSEFSGQFRLRIPRSMHALLAQRAQDEGVSQNTLATTFVAHGLGQLDVLANLRREIRAVVQEGLERVNRTSATLSRGNPDEFSPFRGAAATASIRMSPWLN